MVKGISRQVIVVHSPEPKLFDQVIFILKENALGKDGVTDESLMKEARKLIQNAERKRKIPLYRYGPVWAFGGAVMTGIVWWLTTLL